MQHVFPVVYARHVGATAEFFARLGFVEEARSPVDGEPSYVRLARGAAALVVVDHGWPASRHGAPVGDGARFELFVGVDDVDACLADLAAAGVPALRDPVTMPWGERIGYVADPDGNPVALAARVPVPASTT